ncbi:MAG: ArnT family glycosyltransferase [Pirellulales bacterium]
MLPATTTVDPPPPLFDNKLRACQPARHRLPPAWRWLALLLLATFLPRAVMAWRIEAVVPDGPFYISLAKSLESGDYATALHNGVGLNLFPAVLMLLHKLGLPHETAGMAWSLLMSTLVVLPLFGWVRRQFDDRTAIVACLLYAFHGRFIQWAPELIRDPTFWFLAMLTLYLGWRAVVEVRLWQSLAAGVALTLAIHTRSEGWLLLLPILGWAAYRWCFLETARWRVAAGSLLTLAVTPAALLLLNVTWLHDHSQWEWGRFDFVKMLAGGEANDAGRGNVAGAEFSEFNFQLSVFGGQPRAASHPFSFILHPFPTLLAAAEHPKTFVLLRRFVVKIEKALEPLFALLLLFGWWRWRKTYLHGDQLIVGLMNAALVGGMWVCNLRRQEIDSRYFLLMVLTATPYAALGLIQFAHFLQQAVARKGWRPEWGRALPLFLLAVLAIVGAATSWTESSLGPRKEQADLGRWIKKQYGPNQVLAVPVVDGVITYFAEARPAYFIAEQPESLEAVVSQSHPRAVLLVAKHYRSAQRPDMGALSSKVLALGYTKIPADCLPAGSGDSHLFVLPADQPRSARLSPPSDGKIW